MEWKARTLSYGRGWAAGLRGRDERQDIDLKSKVRVAGTARRDGYRDLLPQAEGVTGWGSCHLGVGGS